MPKVLVDCNSCGNSELLEGKRVKLCPKCGSEQIRTIGVGNASQSEIQEKQEKAMKYWADSKIKQRQARESLRKTGTVIRVILGIVAIVLGITALLLFLTHTDPWNPEIGTPIAVLGLLAIILLGIALGYHS